MRIPRLYLENLCLSDNSVTLNKDASRYLLQVLRCKPGQELQLFNGTGLQCSALLESINKQTATLNVVQCSLVNRESTLSIRLALGISKGERMDTAIQKAVELGVTEILPLQTKHSVVNLNSERAEKRRRHWQGIITSACEQCGRNILPILHPVQQLDSWLEQKHTGSNWLFSPLSDQSLSLQAKPDHGVTILIGPEGGFSENEVKRSCLNGFTEINFGPRILRTETAAIASISAIQTLWGDLG